MKVKTKVLCLTSLMILSFILSPKAFATWSVILLDSATKTIGVAGASCTFQVYGIAKIITDKGAIIAQAYSDDGITNQGLEMLRQDASPREILNKLINTGIDREVPFRQYGIATFSDYNNPATFTGDSISYYPFAATASSPGVCVQGNTLADSLVVREVYKAVAAARDKGLSMEEVLMIALEVGSKYGGDNRCGSQTATTAFIQIVKPTDTYCSYLSLRTDGIKKGGPNPVTVIRKELDKLKKQLPKYKCTELAIYPKD
jgi:uncharacterized Ntn-hydrolase superfamily protein